MDSLKPIEDKLADIFKGAPPLPQSTKKMLSDWLRWLAVGVGIVQLLVALSLYNWGRNVDKLVDGINSYTSAFGVASQVENLSIFYWISLIMLVVDAVILLMAYPGLKAKTKDGWSLVFLGALINAFYGVFSAFSNRGGFSSLVFSLISTAAGLYLLFQVRDQYSPKSKKTQDKAA